MSISAKDRITPRRYERTGVLAVHTQAFVELFMVPATRENEQRDNVVIVDICGPLTQHDEGIFDSYEAIRARVQTACESAATAIVLRIDSPGGDVAGCFDTARAIRARCAAAGKQLVAHIEGKACSAAYALAAATSAICISDTAIVGSIGVVSARTDVSAMNTSLGVRVALIASGARKADGDPDAPLTDDELKATQELVDSMASVFFELVAELRGTDAAQVEALQAGLFHGDAAIKARLVDAVQSFDEMLAAIASGRNVVSSPYARAKAALEKAAAGDGANAAVAKRALATLRATSTVSPRPPRAAARASARATSQPSARLSAHSTTTQPPPARPAARKPTMSDFTKLDRLERELVAILRAQGVEIPRPPATTSDAADAERAAWCAQMDRAMGLEALAPQTRRDGSALSCGVMAPPERTATARPVAPPQRVNRPTSQRMPAADPERASYLAAMDAAMGTGTNEPGVRMEGARQIFSPR